MSPLIFLSASVPIMGRGNYYQTADPFLIQLAVREFVIATVKNYQIVWGGHPAITPMIREICSDLEIDYTSHVVLYQSRYFQDEFPLDNQAFSNVILVDAVRGNREESLHALREAMFSHGDFEAAVFIGGMEGIVAEFDLFHTINPRAKMILLPSTGGATLDLWRGLNGMDTPMEKDVDFASIFWKEFRSEQQG